MVTLVTGGASGLGLATTKRFAEQGAKVVMCDLPTSSGEEISKELGENVIFHPCDVSNHIHILFFKNGCRKINWYTRYFCVYVVH